MTKDGIFQEGVPLPALIKFKQIIQNLRSCAFKGGQMS